MARRWRLMAAGGALGAALLLAAACLSSGCGSLGYYQQAVGGHLDLLRRARPVADVVADPATPPAQRERLALTQRLRAFAVDELKLPDGPSYRRFADLGREAVVWNVVAAPELSLVLKTWCFPVMGCVGYRGYFDRAEADALAAELRRQGWEASVYGVPAYSTLGWGNWLGGDPLLSTFIHWPEMQLARLIFHEMSHQRVYVADDTTFNESFAVAVERIGSARWLARHGSDTVRADAERQDARREAFREFTARWRAQLQAIYAGADDPSTQRVRKAAAMAAMRADYEAVKAGRLGGWGGYDRWIAEANNAAFGVLAAYGELVPAFEALFERCGADFERFYDAVQALAPLPAGDRRARLTSPALGCERAS